MNPSIVIAHATLPSDLITKTKNMTNVLHCCSTSKANDIDTLFADFERLLLQDFIWFAASDVMAKSAYIHGVFSH